MPLFRLVAQLCGLLLAVAVTGAVASAPLYGSGELTVHVQQSATLTTRDGQMKLCSSRGYALLPAVTDEVLEMALQQLNVLGTTSALGYMGGSSILSSPACPTNSPSLKCVWYWDQGRYAGAEKPLAFYTGNRNPFDLTGAGMIGTAMKDNWLVDTSNSARFPGQYMQQYGVLIRGYWGSLKWADSSNFVWSYSSKYPADYYTFCAEDKAMTTTTSSPSNGLSAGATAGIAVGIAVVVGVVVGLVLCLAHRSGWCCFAAPAAVADASSVSGAVEMPYTCEACAAASQRGDMSRANSYRSHRSDFGVPGNRSFHDGMSNKSGYSRRSSCYDGVGEAQAWQGDYVTPMADSQYVAAAPGPYAGPVMSRHGSMMMLAPMAGSQHMAAAPGPYAGPVMSRHGSMMMLAPMAGSQHMAAAPGPYAGPVMSRHGSMMMLAPMAGSQHMAAAPGPYVVLAPSRRGSMMMTTPMSPPMMGQQQPPHMMAQPMPPMAMHNSSQNQEMPPAESGVFPSEPQDTPPHRHPSNANLDECEVSAAHDTATADPATE